MIYVITIISNNKTLYLSTVDQFVPDIKYSKKIYTLTEANTEAANWATLNAQVKTLQ